MRKMPVIAAAGCLLVMLSGLMASAAEVKIDTGRDVTFISTSDSHFKFGKGEDMNARDLDTIRAINSLHEICWPDELGGGRIKGVRGVTLLGDVIDDGDMAREGVNVSEKQYQAFLEVFGLDGKDGILKYPVFETWGNHDGPPVGAEKNGFSSQANLKQRNLIRKEKGLVSNLSDTGLHYSWDWDDVHFVSLGIYPADKQRDGIRYNPVWHNPQGALSFLKVDLAKNVGDSGRPVVLMAHMGMDTDWWVKEDWADFYDACKRYNVIAYIFGHSGTGVREWAPEGETKKMLLINEGQTENGFFVLQVRDNELRYGQRLKKYVPGKKTADGKETRIWNGEWEWRWTGKVQIPAKTK